MLSHLPPPFSPPPPPFRIGLCSRLEMCFLDLECKCFVQEEEGISEEPESDEFLINELWNGSPGAIKDELLFLSPPSLSLSLPFLFFLFLSLSRMHRLNVIYSSAAHFLLLIFIGTNLLLSFILKGRASLINETVADYGLPALQERLGLFYSSMAVHGGKVIMWPSS